MGSGSATGFSCGEISAFFTEIFFLISFVIFNSTLYTPKYLHLINSIQILDLILGSTCIQKRRNFEATVTCQQ